MMLALLLAAAEPAAAAAAPTEAMKQAVIDAIRNCPKTSESEIAVCAPDKGYSRRYRIEKMPDRYVAAAEAAKRPLIEVEGAPPIDACGPVGAAGATGCSLAQARAWAEAKARAKAAGDWVPW